MFSNQDSQGFLFSASPRRVDPRLAETPSRQMGLLGKILLCFFFA
jgi:hypothetical protein